MGQAAPETMQAAPTTPAVDPLITFATRLPMSQPKRLKQAALDDGRTVQSIVQEAIDCWLVGRST